MTSLILDEILYGNGVSSRDDKGTQCFAGIQGVEGRAGRSLRARNDNIVRGVVRLDGKIDDSISRRDATEEIQRLHCAHTWSKLPERDAFYQVGPCFSVVTDARS